MTLVRRRRIIRRGKGNGFRIRTEFPYRIEKETLICLEMNNPLFAEVSVSL
nr:MAG TPA: hypothetical protein [Caudoviricetes sp.]